MYALHHTDLSNVNNHHLFYNVGNLHHTDTFWNPCVVLSCLWIVWTALMYCHVPMSHELIRYVLVSSNCEIFVRVSHMWLSNVRVRREWKGLVSDVSVYHTVCVILQFPCSCRMRKLVRCVRVLLMWVSSVHILGWEGWSDESVCHLCDSPVSVSVENEKAWSDVQLTASGKSITRY